MGLGPPLSKRGVEAGLPSLSSWGGGACHPKCPHPISGNIPISAGSSWAAEACPQPPGWAPAGRKGQ